MFEITSISVANEANNVHSLLCTLFQIFTTPMTPHEKPLQLQIHTDKLIVFFCTLNDR